MKKNILIVLGISVLAILVAALFVIAMNSSKKGKELAIAEEKIMETNKSNSIIQGEQYEKEAKYAEAKAAYLKAIEESSDNEVIKEAEKKIYGLNMKLLFSPIMTEGSAKYIVVKGDTLDKIAKQFGTTRELLMRSNALSDDRIRPGMELKVSVAKYSIIVDKSQNLLILKSGDEILKVYNVSTGENKSTPIGTFKVINKLLNPTWYAADTVVPPGSPENILGSRWIGLSIAKYGIHGTNQPETVGKHVTAGCIRMANGDVEELYDIIPLGTDVTIVD